MKQLYSLKNILMKIMKEILKVRTSIKVQFQEMMKVRQPQLMSQVIKIVNAFL